MKVYIKNYTFMFKHGRNVVIATLYNVAGEPLMTDQLSHLLKTCEQQGLTLENSYEVLREVVLTHGFTG